MAAAPSFRLGFIDSKLTGRGELSTYVERNRFAVAALGGDSGRRDLARGACDSLPGRAADASDRCFLLKEASHDPVTSAHDRRASTQELFPQDSQCLRRRRRAVRRTLQALARSVERRGDPSLATPFEGCA